MFRHAHPLLFVRSHHENLLDREMFTFPVGLSRGFRAAVANQFGRNGPLELGHGVGHGSCDPSEMEAARRLDILHSACAYIA
jgi:hypothetical protein